MNVTVNRTQLKLLAIVAMLINHTCLLADWMQPPIWIVGCITAPIMMYLLVQGLTYTHSKKRYFSRLLAFAILSQVPFSLAFGTLRLNFLFTLVVAFMFLFFLEKFRSRWQATSFVQNLFGLFMCAVFFMLFGFCDWSWLAFVECLIFYWLKLTKPLYSFSLVSLMYGLFMASRGYMISVYGIGMVLLILVGLMLTYCYHGKQGKYRLKWFFYGFYPLHLLFLLLVF